MFQKICCIACFLMCSVTLFSQENSKLTESKKAPLSIYTEDIFNDEFKANFNLTSTFLSFKEFKFLKVDEVDIANNLFTIDFRNFGRKGSTFSYESYNKAHLYKHFPRLPDINDVIQLNNSRLGN